ncbi:MAG: GtrA family protein, partial [Candidatus Moranbacteria bacterium]|nr:GtrA family protein [Candidatus Moranbacteria bacterium]
MLTKKDYILVSIIGFCFALFSIPIIKNLDLEILRGFSINFRSILFLVLFFTIFANLALYIASVLNEKIKIALQFAKFGAVGAFNTFLDWGVLNLLIMITGISGGLAYSGFKSISFIIAAVSAYFWNKYWTFDSQQETNSEEIFNFSVVTGIGFVINVSLASLIVFIFKGTTIVTPEQLANLGAAAATVIS